MYKLTACLVSANRPEELRQAIDSLSSQSFSDFEIILSDDSTDCVIKDYFLSKFPNGKYFHHSPPLGEIKNTNFAINNAATEYIVLCHDDDFFERTYFEECFIGMLKDSLIDMSFSGRLIIDENNKILTKNLISDPRTKFIYPSISILNQMLYNLAAKDYRVPINTPGLFFKKIHFLEVNGLNQNVNTHCDTEFLLKMLSVTKKVLFINKSIYYSKLWNNSSGRSKSSEKCQVFEAELDVLNCFCDFNKLPRLNDPRRNEIHKQYAIRCCNFNGPMMWMALRSKLGIIKTKAAILHTAVEIIKLNKLSLLLPWFYINFLIAVLSPQSVLIKLQKQFTALLNTKT